MILFKNTQPIDNIVTPIGVCKVLESVYIFDTFANPQNQQLLAPEENIFYWLDITAITIEDAASETFTIAGGKDGNAFAVNYQAKYATVALGGNKIIIEEKNVLAESINILTTGSDNTWLDIKGYKLQKLYNI